MEDKVEFESGFNKTISGTFVGILFSLAAIALWVILAYLEFIAGLAGALMGILFIIGYKKINPKDNSHYSKVAACILIAVEIVIAELLTVLVICNIYAVPFSDAMQTPQIKEAVIIDVVIGLILSYVVFVAYLVGLKKKESITDTDPALKRVSAPLSAPAAAPASEETTKISEDEPK